MTDVNENSKKQTQASGSIIHSVNKIKIKDLNEKKRLSISPRNLNADLQLESH